MSKRSVKAFYKYLTPAKSLTPPRIALFTCVVLAIKTSFMGLLEKLWDDTLAGPQPETGLGRLRKPASFTFRSNSGKDLSVDLPEEKPKVTRSIMIKKPAGYSSPTNGTPPASPAGTTPPVSPFSGSKEWNRFRRSSSSFEGYERGVGGGLAKSPSSSYEV